jgi:hypothetical protein
MNDLVVVPTNVNQLIQIGEIIDIIQYKKPSIERKNDNQTNDLEVVDAFHFIESDLFSYPSNIRPEDQIGLKDFILLMTPVLCIGILLFFPFPAFASEKIK